MIGENAATAQLRDDTTIEATAPSLPQGVWDVRVVNPDTGSGYEQRLHLSGGSGIQLS